MLKFNPEYLENKPAVKYLKLRSDFVGVLNGQFEPLSYPTNWVGDFLVNNVPEVFAALFQEWLDYLKINDIIENSKNLIKVTTGTEVVLCKNYMRYQSCLQDTALLREIFKEYIIGDEKDVK